LTITVTEKTNNNFACSQLLGDSSIVRN